MKIYEPALLKYLVRETQDSEKSHTHTHTHTHGRRTLPIIFCFIFTFSFLGLSQDLFKLLGFTVHCSFSGMVLEMRRKVPVNPQRETIS